MEGDRTGSGKCSKISEGCLGGSGDSEMVM